MNTNFRYATAVQEQREVTLQFECDYNTLQVILDDLSQGRNVRHRDLIYKCGWLIRDLEDGVYIFDGYLHQALVIQMHGVDI